MPAVEVDYRAIPRVRRLAMFFAIVGPDNATQVLKSFDDEQTEAIVRELAQLDLVDESLQRQVLEEFSGLLVESATSVRGGYEVALQVYEGARGAGRARGFASKLGPSKQARAMQEDFSGMNGRQILGLLRSEQAQTVAYVLSAMDAPKAAEVLREMPEEQRKEVVVRMSRLSPTPSDVLHKVVANVLGKATVQSQSSVLSLGGSVHIAAVLKELDATVSKQLLGDIESADATAGAAIAKEMFSFRDLVDLPQEAMQLVMREIDTATMVVAMKSAEPELMEKIYGGLSKRGAEALREEFELQGPLRKKEVEAAQNVVLDCVRKLEEEGQINLGGGDDEYV